MAKTSASLLTTLLLLPLLLSSCGDGTLQHSLCHVRGTEGWSADDTISIEVPAPGRDFTGYVDVEMRIRGTFPYTKVWLEVEQLLEEPSLSRTDTVCMDIMTADGEDLGSGVTLGEYSCPGSVGIHLEAGQHGRLRIRHLMHRSLLPGIREVGARITSLHHPEP